jgi:hypothetical protein
MSGIARARGRVDSHRSNMNESSAADSQWDNTPSRNLLLAENMELVRRELRNDGVVFGWHYYFAGGRSGEMFCFSDFDSYNQEVQNSRAGDHFTVYSRNQLAGKAMLRVGDVASDQPTPNARDLVEIRNALTSGKEIVFVRSHKHRETGEIECEAGILWNLGEEELEQALGVGSSRPGEFLFFLVPMLNEDAQGIPIESVSPGARHRVHAVVDGKRPNEAGLTPASGPY